MVTEKRGKWEIYISRMKRFLPQKKGIFERASNDSLRRDKNQLFLYFSVDICSLLYFSRFIRFIVCPSDCMDIESLVCQNSFKF